LLVEQAQARPIDLVVTADRVVCPVTGWDGPGAVAIAGDRIVAVTTAGPPTAAERLDLGDVLLLAGLVDLHAHPAVSGENEPAPDMILAEQLDRLRPGDVLTYCFNVVGQLVRAALA
jgi:predicted amidohydrolase